jgi:S1-C subfamily serine protease
MGGTVMRIAATVFVVSAAMFAGGTAAAQGPQIATGSGVAVAAGGEVLTNAHVVEACGSIKLTFADGVRIRVNWSRAISRTIWPIFSFLSMD